MLYFWWICLFHFIIIIINIIQSLGDRVFSGSFFFNLFETLTVISVNLKKGVGIIAFSGKITFI